MKIAFLILSSFTNLGGAQIFTLRLICEMVRKGYTVVLYMDAREWRNNKKRFLNAPFEIKPILCRTNLLSRLLPFIVGWFLRSEQQKYKYDLWQVIGAYPAGYVAARLPRKVPVVLRAHGDDVQMVPEIGYGICLNSEIRKKVTRTLHRMQGLVALTKDICHAFCFYGVLQNKIRIIPNAIDLSLFENNHMCIEKRRGSVEQKGKGIKILTVGRNHFKKGYDLIPSIAKGLQERGIAFKWTIVTNKSDVLEEQLKKLGLIHMFSFIHANGKEGEYIDVNGKVNLPNDDIRNEYKNSAIFVLPTRVEGFGMVFIEALAAGLPIVSTKARGVRDVLCDGETALLAEVDNTEQMIGFICSLGVNKELYNKLVLNGLKYAKEFDLKKIADRYVEFYEECIN